MKYNSTTKNRASNSGEKESPIDIKTEKKEGNYKKYLSKINKSYSNLTNSNTNLKLLNKNKEENLGLYERIDYSRKIKQAKEVDDLKKIYEKWSGKKLDWTKRNSTFDEDYYYQKRKNKYLDYSSNESKIPKYESNNYNNRYKNLYLDDEKSDLLFSKPKKKINLKKVVIKRNYSYDKKNDLTKNNNEGNNLKNSYMLLYEKKYGEKDSESKKKENNIKNKKIEDKKNIIVFNSRKFAKEDTSETNDESVSVKFKNKPKFDLSTKLISEKIYDDKKYNFEKNKRNKITLKLNFLNKTSNYNKKKNNNNELNDIIKKGTELFSDINNVYKNLPEKLDFILELDKYIRKEINLNKDDNLILPEKAVYYVDNIIIRFLGYFGSELKLRNCNTYIEKKPTKYSLRDIIFKIIASGLATQKIYKLYLDNDDYKSLFEENEEEWMNFLDDIKTKLSNKFRILDEDIYFFGYSSCNFEVNLLIYDKKIIGIEDFLRNNNLKVRTCNLLNNIILSPNIFETEFCKNVNEWPKKNLMRGGKKYYPPYGWFGISLRVKKKYGKSLKWLGKENQEEEWPIAYHGVGKDNVFNKVVNILNGNLKEEEGRLYKYEYNIEKTKNKYTYCGEGVYFSPNIEDAVKFTDKTSLGIFNIKFQFVFMARVNPNKIRSPAGKPVQWILSANNNEIRPYRLLFKFISI